MGNKNIVCANILVWFFLIHQWSQILKIIQLMITYLGNYSRWTLNSTLDFKQSFLNWNLVSDFPFVPVWFLHDGKCIHSWSHAADEEQAVRWLLVTSCSVLYFFVEFSPNMEPAHRIHQNSLLILGDFFLSSVRIELCHWLFSCFIICTWDAIFFGGQIFAKLIFCVKVFSKIKVPL